LRAATPIDMQSSEWQALRADLVNVRSRYQLMMERAAQLERDIAGAKRRSAGVEYLRAKLREGEADGAQMEATLCRVRGETQGVKERVQDVERIVASLRHQIEQQQASGLQFRQGLQRDLRQYREALDSAEHCAQQEQEQKERAIQEAHTYKSLHEQCRAQLEVARNEQERLTAERRDLESGLIALRRQRAEQRQAAAAAARALAPVKAEEKRVKQELAQVRAFLELATRDLQELSLSRECLLQ
jgi:chromosome segregation ATPase